jgi:hypothetical protein
MRPSILLYAGKIVIIKASFSWPSRRKEKYKPVFEELMKGADNDYP